jgi:hypothetical protein
MALEYFKMRLKINAIALALTFTSSSAIAGVCDFRLSQMVSPAASTTAVVAGGAGATIGPGAMAIGGLYFFPHAASGTVMLGSTLAGASGLEL